MEVIAVQDDCSSFGHPPQTCFSCPEGADPRIRCCPETSHSLPHMLPLLHSTSMADRSHGTVTYCHLILSRLSRIPRRSIDFFSRSLEALKVSRLVGREVPFHVSRLPKRKGPLAHT